MEFKSKNCENKNKKVHFDFISLNWGLIWWVYLHITLLIALFSKSFNLCQAENSFADFLDKTCLRKTYNKTLSRKMYTKIFQMSNVYINAFIFAYSMDIS